MRLQFLAKKNLVSHNVIANSRQFIAQRFSGQARISLRHFAVIIASETLIVSTRQMGRLGIRKTSNFILLLPIYNNVLPRIL
jgi:hypothetical protein